MDEIQFDRMQEQAALGAWADELEAELKKRNEGRNLSCWPLGSFGWKDADLDPGGCTGIARIVGLNDQSVTIEVGGHKAFFPPDQDGELSYEDDMMQAEIVNDAVGDWDCEWDGDDRWIASFSREITIEDTELTEEQLEGSAGWAEVIVARARAACREFEDAMSKASAEIDEAFGN